MEEFKAEYAFIFFVVFIGAVYRLSQGDNSENHTILQRVISQLVTVMFAGLLLIGIFLIWLKWNVWIPVVMGIPVGIQGEKFLRLWMQYGNQATGLLDFIQRMRKAYKAVEQDSTSDEETH